MRVWHKSLLKVLPQEYLLQQWRDCGSIVKVLAGKGKTDLNNIVAKVLDYPVNHFFVYADTVREELEKHNTTCNFDKFVDVFPYDKLDTSLNITIDDVFPDWHNDRYLKQCYYMLEERADCKLLSEEDFAKIQEVCKPLFASEILRDTTHIELPTNTVSEKSKNILLDLLKSNAGFKITL